MSQSPHKDKLIAAMRNPKCPKEDISLLSQAKELYDIWKEAVSSLNSTGKKRVEDLTRLLNGYKNYIEVEVIAKQGSAFIKRQKGQLKLDNSIMEEFLCDLIHPTVLKGLPDFPLEIGPKTAFMSLSFAPPSLASLNDKPVIALKLKDQDFIIGKDIHYKFSSDDSFSTAKTASGSFALAVLAAECKINLDKTMFQEAAGTAARLKQGCPYSKYYILNEYLDMEPEDCRLTAIDNVFLLRHAKRLPFEKRNSYEEVRKQHEEKPIDLEIMWMFVKCIQKFIDSVWYNPSAALKRGTFI